MELSVFNDTVRAELPLVNGKVNGHITPVATIRFKAANIRKERTGVHAAVYIGLNDSILEWDEFNLLRREERTRLANAAHKVLPPVVQSLISKDQLNAALGEFFLGVWTTWTEHEKPSYVVGLQDGSPPVFYLKPFVIQGGGTILFGEPKMGKSFIGLTMAVCMDAGLLSVWPTTQTRVLFINLERSEESLQRRLGRVNAALGLDPNRELLILNARGRTLRDVRDAAERGIKDEGVGCTVLDSLSRAGVGDLTENTPANNAMDTLNGLPCPSWLALAHSPRGDNSHVFGSQMFDAAGDILVQQMSERRENGVGVALQITGGNDIGAHPLSMLAFSFSEAGLERIWIPSQREFPELLATRKLTLADEIAELLANDGYQTIEEMAGKLGKDRTRISKQVNVDPRFSQKGKAGRQLLWGLADE